LPGEAHYGIYRYRNSDVVRVADSNLALPGGAKPTFVYGSVGGGGGYSAFYGDSSDDTGRRSGIYLANSNDQVTVVADNNTLIPGSSAKFSDFFDQDLAADGPDVAFQGYDPTGLGGVYRRVSGSLQLVARSLQPAPGGGTFSINGVVPLSLDAGHIALEAPFTASRYGIFTDMGGPLRRIIATGDTVDGKVISELRMNDDALQGTTIAFVARFSDGSQAIYLANVPEPAQLAGFIPLLVFFRRQRRRQ